MIFLTRKKLGKIIQYEMEERDEFRKSVFARRQSDEINRRINNALLEDKENNRIAKELKQWCEFYDSEKVGYLIKYDGLEWECVSEAEWEKTSHPGFFRITYVKKITLSLCGQTKEVNITRDKPKDISFVIEGEAK